ncbi:MAG: oxygen-independent coproporphyrinogen III oxidase [Ignavibacteria bacterium GWA2_55_11]|nr:MAG: oxygen-independent coproporphyrinogen III oxidase [Ignavibacteria bacterium GWA2_55_11]OGU43640.1 MAG: oxygen-independent coproporphyrinogen III oxidase [Ignavibacteria bacterium GWC2_56_12]OGU63852.1 MAG: oxygen-independent coproporphyrinogen III oxidase [Ignavibacteria bacterium RIFCSPHIGHO2_02_FULL_56_12]OGU69919.1 MAG: oxygen-independent coproporphyrinogen III oxidase [Ignavibacteria bacterium RIFCSPLOWO2_02_FULL_55_14]OGU76408.1 MAG: oxygen-independent coproporphyrinogen III oxidas
MIIDDRLIELLKTFSKQGPRYTSYPTAPMFSSDYNDKRFEVDLIRNNHNNPGPVSLYLHIPFCDSLCYFCGCTTIITNNREKIRTYLDALKREILLTSAYVERQRQVTQMHWGGGTPSYLDPSEIRDLMDVLRRRFNFAPDAEISVEIDPRGLTFDHMKAFREGGVNRVSLGIQDFDTDVQRAVNRVQSEQLTLDAMRWAKELGIDSVNFDLIYGLPLQTTGSFQHTLHRVVAMRPNRIAAFSFAYVPWMKKQQNLLNAKDMPAADAKLQLLKATIDTLTGAGYEYIGMDHFAVPEDELSVAMREKRLHRNFQGYSTRAGADLFAFGMSSISHFGDVYAQNYKELPEYLAAVDARQFPTAVGYKMTRDDQVRKFVIMRLMCDLEVDKEEVEDLFGINFDQYFDMSRVQMFDYIRHGLVADSPSKIVVSDSGRLLVRNIAMCYDAYLNRFKSEENVFSKTV